MHHIVPTSVQDAALCWYLPCSGVIQPCFAHAGIPCACLLHTAETGGYMHGVPSSHHGAPPSASSSSSSSSPSYAYSYDVAPRPPCPPPARTSRLSFAGMMTWMSCHQEESRGGTAGGLSSGRHRHDDVIIEACHHPAWYHGGISGRLNDGH